MKKKTLVLLLALCMVVSLLPVNSYATREYRYKQPVKVSLFKGGDTLVRFTATSYNEFGQLCLEQTMERQGDDFVETGFIRNTFDAYGNQTQAECLRNGERWTETHSYERLSDHADRLTTVRMPGNIITVCESEYAEDGSFLRDTTTVDGKLVSRSEYVNGDGVYYYVVTNYDEHGEATLHVSIFDTATDLWLNSYDCDDLSEVSVSREMDTQGNTTEITVACREERSTSYFSDGRLVKCVSYFGSNGMNISYYDNNHYDNNHEPYCEEIYYDGVFFEKHELQFDEQGYCLKRIDTDANGNVKWVAVYEYQEFVIPAEPTFYDVPVDAFYFEPVEWAVENGITNGTGGGAFSPNATCTRGQVVTFLWRAMGCPEPENIENPFTDVSPNDYFYDAVLWAVQQGITNGTSKTTFSPGAPCTRAHVVTFLWRAEHNPAADGSNPFGDVQTEQYYTDAVLWAVSQGITNGTSATTFSPGNDCTRGQIVTFLFRDMA